MSSSAPISPKPVGYRSKKYEGTITVKGYWFNATPTELMDVIDDALHAKGFCGCATPAVAGYIIGSDLSPEERRGYPDDHRP